MCGRYTLRRAAEEMMAWFRAHRIRTFPRRYNITPAQEVSAVVQPKPGERLWAAFRWGLVPHWSKDPKVSFSNINARSETVARSPAFRGAYQHRRCLLPADGFYEWSGPKGNKRATFFHLKDDGLFAFAGLYGNWERDGEVLDTCALLTRAANEVVKPIHNRMPVLLLTQDDFAAWLDEAAIPHPTDPGRMAALAVGRYVNSSRNEGAKCLEPDAA
jgi:putative SOS response-associated peptidase YedK